MNKIKIPIVYLIPSFIIYIIGTIVLLHNIYIK
jgi:hypothetical protein